MRLCERQACLNLSLMWVEISLASQRLEAVAPNLRRMRVVILGAPDGFLACLCTCAHPAQPATAARWCSYRPAPRLAAVLVSFNVVGSWVCFLLAPDESSAFFAWGMNTVAMVVLIIVSFEFASRSLRRLNQRAADLGGSAADSPSPASPSPRKPTDRMLQQIMRTSHRVAAALTVSLIGPLAYFPAQEEHLRLLPLLWLGQLTAYGGGAAAIWYICGFIAYAVGEAERSRLAAATVPFSFRGPASLRAAGRGRGTARVTSCSSRDTACDPNDPARAAASSAVSAPAAASPQGLLPFAGMRTRGMSRGEGEHASLRGEEEQCRSHELRELSDVPEWSHERLSPGTNARSSEEVSSLVASSTRGSLVSSEI